jgi:hypothetical protein
MKSGFVGLTIILREA